MIKIEISGPGDEVRNELLKLLGLQPSVVETPPHGREETVKQPQMQQAPKRGRRARTGKELASAPQAPWTEEEAEKLLKKMKPEARRIIAEVAKRPEGYKRSELMQVLGLKGRSIGGWLGSVGRAVKRIGNKPSPLSREKVNGEFVYKLDSVLANVAKKLAA